MMTHTSHRTASIRPPARRKPLAAGLVAVCLWSLAAQTSPAQQEEPVLHYRLTKVIIPELVTDPNAEGYHAGAQRAIKDGSRSVERLADGTVLIKTLKPEWNYSFLIDLANQKIHFTDVTGGNLKSVNTFSLPPKSHSSTSKFTIRVAMTGRPYQSIIRYWASPRNVVEHGTGGVGSPMRHVKDEWTWPPNLNREQSGTFVGTGTISPPKRSTQDIRERKPWYLYFGVQTGRAAHELIIVRYDMVAVDGEHPDGNQVDQTDITLGGDSNNAVVSGTPGNTGGNTGNGNNTNTTGSNDPGNTDNTGGNNNTGTGTTITNPDGSTSTTTVLGPDDVLISNDPPLSTGSTQGRPQKMTIIAGKRTAKPGEIVEVPIYIVSASNVANLNATITYNSTIAAATGDPLAGNILPSGTLFAGNSAERGTVRVGFAGRSGAAGNGTVAVVRFRAAGKPGDVTPLTVAVTKIDNPGGKALTIDVVHGSITIVDQNGQVPGDLDGDGKVTALDAMLALKMSVKKIPERGNYDLDSDRTVTSRDAVLILERAITRGVTP